MKHLEVPGLFVHLKLHELFRPPRSTDFTFTILQFSLTERAVLKRGMKTMYFSKISVDSRGVARMSLKKEQPSQVNGKLCFRYEEL